MSTAKEATGSAKWYALRDLKRANAKQSAYKLFESKEMEVFTPTKWQLITRNGEKIREEVPIISDLLFVHDTRENLDPIVNNTDTLQYRYQRGGYCVPIVVPDTEMAQFIHAVRSSKSPQYFLPDEITPQMHGRKIHIVGGPLNGYEGRLLTTRGSKVKRLLVEMKGFLSVGVEVEPEYIELI